MFYFKKVVGFLIDPLSVVLLLLLLGCAAILLRRHRVALACCGGAFVVLFLASWDPVVRRVSALLEPPTITLPESLAEAPCIVVLGTGVVESPYPIAVGTLESAALARLVTALEIAQRYPGATLITSGAGAAGHPGSGEVMRTTAIALGFPAEQTVALTEPRDTRAEAVAVRDWLEERTVPVLLVTSATHLRRATAHFRSQGIDPFPIAAEPYGHTERPEVLGPLPAPEHLKRSSAVVHESAGIAWAILSGQFEWDDLKIRKTSPLQ